MVISSGLDIGTSRKLQRRHYRKCVESLRLAKYRRCSDDAVLGHGTNCLDSSDSDDDLPLSILGAKLRQSAASSTSTVGTASSVSPQTNYLRKDVPTLARECDRYGLSDRSAAAIASAVLQDFGLISVGDSINVIDRNRVRRARDKLRTKSKTKKGSDEQEQLCGLFFDGRKDHTIMTVKSGSRNYNRKALEEHISLIEEPGSKFIGHVSPKSGSAVDIKNSIRTFFTDNNVSLDNLRAVGCEGTNVYTGRNGGAIRLLEEELKKPLQWLVCQLHANELPLQHLVEYLDGSTVGPRAFSGPIGSCI